MFEYVSDVNESIILEEQRILAEEKRLQRIADAEKIRLEKEQKALALTTDSENDDDFEDEDFDDEDSDDDFGGENFDDDFDYEDFDDDLDEYFDDEDYDEDYGDDFSGENLDEDFAADFDDEDFDYEDDLVEDPNTVYRLTVSDLLSFLNFKSNQIMAIELFTNNRSQHLKFFEPQ